MRTTNSRTGLVTRRVELDVSGNVTGTSSIFVPDQTLKSMARSDIQKTVAGPDGFRPPTGYLLQDLEYSEWRGLFKYAGWWGGRIDNPAKGPGMGAIGAPKTDIPPFPGWLKDRTETRALIKLKQQNVNYAVALAEARRSMGMIARNLLVLAEAYRYAKKGAWGSAAAKLGLPTPSFKKTSKDLASRWLELQYGWLPLLSDIKGAYDDGRAGLMNYDPVISVKHTSRHIIDVPGSYTDAATGFKVKQSGSGFHLCKVRLDYTIENSWLRAASKVGVLNPLEIAWEVVPYSFVVDWALPIGEWISSFDAAMGLTFKAGTRTELTRLTRSFSIAHSSTASGWQELHCSASSRVAYFQRFVYGSTPVPLPYWKNPVSTTHVQNALALFVAQSHKR